MRPELQQLDYYVYGLSESDFGYVFDLVKRIRLSHLELTQQQIAPMRSDPEAEEAVDDLAYYTYVDTVFLWEYALWRMQGVLEGLISTRYLEHRRAGLGTGLASRLRGMRASGFTLSDKDEQSLLAWARLRNALSHQPPESHRPVWIEEEDAAEYRSLVERICTTWRAEMESLKPFTTSPSE